VIYCTYCSALKNPASGELPAVRRYLSERIEIVATAATQRGHGFLILSGKYGLLHPDTPIPYYDHLLQDHEVTAHSGVVCEQLRALGVRKLVYFTRPPTTDPNLQSYLDCIRRAVAAAGAEFEYVELDPEVNNT